MVGSVDGVRRLLDSGSAPHTVVRRQPTTSDKEQTTPSSKLKPSDTAMRQVALRMPEELIAALSEVAAEQDRPLSYVVRLAAREYLARKKAAA